MSNEHMQLPASWSARHSIVDAGKADELLRHMQMAFVYCFLLHAIIIVYGMPICRNSIYLTLCLLTNLHKT